MATLYGLNATKRDNVVPSQKIDAQDAGGRVRCAYDEYDLATLGVVLGATDVIRMAKLPAGARVVGYTLKSADMGTTGSCDVGYEANGVDAAAPSAFLASVDLNAAAITISQADQENEAGLFKKFTVETQISISMAAASTAITGKISLAVFFTLD